MNKPELLRMNLQFFADDDGSISDMDGLDAFLAGMDGSEDTTTTDANDEQDDGAQDDGATDEGTSTDDEGTTDGTTPPPAQKPGAKPDQQSFAFAQLRVQNNQYRGVLAKLAQATGVQYTDENDLINKLNDAVINKIAKAQNMPPEFLKRMETLEMREQARLAEQLKEAAFIGFQKVKDTYGLKEEELRAFAGELDAAKKNPFVTEVDLLAEYKLRHFDEIQEKRIKAAVEAALKTSQAADKHSSTPPAKQGKSDSGATPKITTMGGLDDFLKGIK